MKPITFARYTAGDGLRSTVEVRDPQTGTLVDPDTILMKLRDPAGNETAVTPLRLDTGTYEATATLDENGTWWRQWVTTDPTGVDEEAIIVHPSQFS